MSRWDTFLEHCWKNIDKLMLFAMFVIAISAALWMQSHAGMDESAFDWARHNTDLILAGLLGLMTGRAIEKATNPPSDGEPKP